MSEGEELPGEPRLIRALRRRDRFAEARIEAEFHAGWIALRFLNDPAKAAPHFARMAGIAATPLSLSRAFYWQGRAAEAAPDGGEAARGFYDRAAAWPATFHG